MIVHGIRRAAEMREVTLTVQALGLAGGISSAAADWQAQVGAPGAGAPADDLLDSANALLACL
jgi:hypothetical protein